jgi:hypothetical protein
MGRQALALLAAAGLLLAAGCTQQPVETPVPPPPPPVASAPTPTPGKQRIPNIDKLTLAQVKGYYDECMAFNNIGHPDVPYVAEDCRRIRARWDRRDMAKQSTVKNAPNLPVIH